MEQIKCVVVGDGAVGKTSMLIRYVSNDFPTDYVPTVFDNYQANVLVGGKPISLALWDTAGQEDYDRLRPLSYPNTDIFIICHSVANPVSLQNIFNKWIMEIRKYSPDAPFLIVGTKSDVRFDESMLNKLRKRSIQIWSTEKINDYINQQVRDLGPHMKPAYTLECSAKTTQNNLQDVFNTAMKVVLTKRSEDEKKMKKGRLKYKKRKDDCILL